MVQPSKHAQLHHGFQGSIDSGPGYIRNPSLDSAVDLVGARMLRALQHDLEDGLPLNGDGKSPRMAKSLKLAPSFSDPTADRRVMLAFSWHLPPY
jgi:hypothetical protein